MLQSVIVANVDEPLVKVASIHLDNVELYCNTWLFDTLDKVTSDNISKLSSSVELIHFVPFHFKLWFTERDDNVTSDKFDNMLIVLYNDNVDQPEPL